jgi:PTH1 family peptidyl-tRNA hydrolase
VARHLGSDRFARLRVGVGRQRTGDLVGHVLGAYASDEVEPARAAEERAASAVIDWLHSGLEACMNRYNGPPAPTGGEDGTPEREEERP